MELNGNLKRIKHHLKKAEFENAKTIVLALKAAEIPTGKDLKECPADTLAAALNLRSVAAEVLDYFGLYALANDFVEKPGEYCYARLKSILRPESLILNDDTLTLQHVWVVLQAGLCNYRSGGFDDAMSMFSVCNGVVSKAPMSTAEHQRYGTRARCVYSMGLVHRERYQMKEAIETFTESTVLASHSLMGKADTHSQLALVAIARAIGMGLASVHSTLGRPDMAVPLLMAAKSMLPKFEKVIAAHIDLIRATLSPWSYTAGGEYVGYEDDDRIADLKRCHQAFLDLGHQLYRARAAYVLAKEYIGRVKPAGNAARHNKGNQLLSQAEELISEFEAAGAGDSRFHLLGFVLRSEIARKIGDFAQAEKLASSGLQLTSNSPYPAVHLDMLMARGQIRIDKGDFERAIEDLRAGLELAKDVNNHHLYSIFLLRLSQTYALNKAERHAEESFSQFKEMEHFLEVKTPDVAALEEETKVLLNREDNDFVLSYADDFDPEQAAKDFRKFLVKWARSKVKTDTAAAEKLKISRQAFYNWTRLPD